MSWAASASFTWDGMATVPFMLGLNTLGNETFFVQKSEYGNHGDAPTLA